MGKDACNDDQPFHLPPPRNMAETLMARAWDDDCPDRERLMLEQAALTIMSLLANLAAATEREDRWQLREAAGP
jgi:hypothetical protein